MRALLALLGIAAAFASPAHAQNGGLQVSPVLVDIAAERGVASFRLNNARANEAAFEIEVFAWSQENGESVLTPSRDLIVAPSVFLVGPQREQIVRLGVAASARGEAIERSYRILLRELPSNAEARSGLRVQVEMSMPVFVRPRGAMPELIMTRTRDANGQPAIRLTNTGSSRVSLALQNGPDDIAGLPRYLLAGSSVVRPLAASQRSVTLTYADATSTTPNRRQFELDDAPVLAAQR